MIVGRKMEGYLVDYESDEDDDEEEGSEPKEHHHHSRPFCRQVSPSLSHEERLSLPPPPPPQRRGGGAEERKKKKERNNSNKASKMSSFRFGSRFRTAFSSSFLRSVHSQTSPGRRLDDAGPLACRLESRSVLRFRGPDTVKFLQGLLTNDIRPLAARTPPTDSRVSQASYLPTPNLTYRSPPPIYAALLTPQGRFLYDLFLYRPPRPDEKLDGRTGSGSGSADSEEPFTLLADVDTAVVDDLLDCFKKYCLRSKVGIDNVDKEFSCWQRFGSNLSSNSASAEEPEAASVGWGGVGYAGIAAAQGNDLSWQWFKDPRLNCLGFRGIFPANATPPLVEADKEASEWHYLQWRLEKGVPEGSTEIPKGEAVPLEYNLVGLNAISFDKGCYVGQELVARTHHRGVIRKRLLPLKFVNDNGEDLQQAVSPNSDIVNYASDKKVGTVTTALGCRGMGLVRLEEVLKQSPNLRIEGQDEVRIKAMIPDWWPAEWTQVQDQQQSAAAA
ncbi:unnamed protein product [Musa hybrid cultivar]